MTTGTNEPDEPNPWQQLGLPAELLPHKPECDCAQDDQRRKEDEGEKDDDETVDREIARIEARLKWLNWLEFILRPKLN